MNESNESQSFARLPLNEALLANLTSLNYDVMTPIQKLSLPNVLQGEDVIARANTGSGKTTVFGLGILNNLNLKFFGAQALVLCPTRELSEQIAQSLRQLARQMPNVKIINLSGGMPMKAQLDSLRHGAHIIVGTPGRIQKHLDKETLILSGLNSLVLDEADRMLDMGFLNEIRVIIKKCPKKRQTLLFSATYPPEIKQLSHEFMQNPKEVFVEQSPIEQHIEQRFYEVNQKDKYSILIRLLKHHQSNSSLIFCNTKQSTTELAQLLKQEGFSAIALNGDMEQSDRDLAIIQFTNQSCSILVATDVAARGLDIKELSLVFNYELAFECDVHTHRIGRTGRAGNKGIAISLVTPADAHRVCLIEDQQTQPLVWGNVVDMIPTDSAMYSPSMVTLCLDLGKKDKIRAGDIVGALTKDMNLPNEVIGKIDVLPFKSYVAIHKSHATIAYQSLKAGKLKGRHVNVDKYAC
ncbi:MAG: ATP-dependent RNA helicase DbpA [Legionellaceae bacterium]|nr:ATP-dependent RNA helicase DbpA [Legionellaceae bacterium]